MVARERALGTELTANGMSYIRLKSCAEIVEDGVFYNLNSLNAHFLRVGVRTTMVDEQH